MTAQRVIAVIGAGDCGLEATEHAREVDEHALRSTQEVTRGRDWVVCVIE